MQYALLAYGSQRTNAGSVEGAIADVLARPYITVTVFRIVSALPLSVM